MHTPESPVKMKPKHVDCTDGSEKHNSLLISVRSNVQNSTTCNCFAFNKHSNFSFQVYCQTHHCQSDIQPEIVET